MLVKAFAEGRFHRRFLQSYDREWKRVLRGEAWMGRIGRKVFEHFSDQQLDRLVRVCGDERVAGLVGRLSVDAFLQPQGEEERPSETALSG